MSTGPVLALAHDNRTRFKIGALVLSAPAVAVIALFTLAHIVGGDLSGLADLLLLLVPLVVILAAAWRFPRAGGAVLAGLGLVFIVAYPFWAAGRDLRPMAIALTEALVLVPPVAAGVLFLAASRAERRWHRRPARR